MGINIDKKVYKVIERHPQLWNTGATISDIMNLEELTYIEVNESLVRLVQNKRVEERKHFINGGEIKYYPKN